MKSSITVVLASKGEHVSILGNHDQGVVARAGYGPGMARRLGASTALGDSEVRLTMEKEMLAERIRVVKGHTSHR